MFDLLDTYIPDLSTTHSLLGVCQIDLRSIRCDGIERKIDHKIAAKEVAYLPGVFQIGYLESFQIHTNHCYIALERVCGTPWLTPWSNWDHYHSLEDSYKGYMSSGAVMGGWCIKNAAE